MTDDDQAFEAALRAIPDDDEHHPLSVLGRWTLMVAEDYGHNLPPRLTLTWCVAYLARTLHRIANDDAQDFPLMRRELRKCRRHLEAVLHNDDRPDRGAPCPECTSRETGLGPRLVRKYAHWCEDEACERFHYEDDREDVWQCPKNRGHVWTHEDYDRWIAERKVGA